MPPKNSSDQPTPPVTLQNIADRLGVTRALVSMALRNSPKVAAATRERVQAMAREMGYRSNPLVRALMSEVRQRRKHVYRATLAFITNLKTENHWQGLTVYPDYFNGAKQAARRLGYDVEHFWLGNYRSNPTRLAEVLRARGIPGVLIPPLPAENHSFDMDLKGFSAVTFGYSMKRPNIPRVCNHHIHTVQLAVEHLVERGYQRIGFALRKDEVAQVNYLWRAGLTVVQYLFPNLTIQIFEPDQWTEEAFQKWVASHRPEVVIGGNKTLWKWMGHLGLRIPEEIGFLHLDCRKDEEISGTYQNTLSLGESGIELLASLVESNTTVEDEQPRVMMLQSDFHEGRTLRPIEK
ncbi:LacI family DNA-binding transcriptional regulator [Puniceicoccus vermicola]|uniref:LacI family DNA-binding transcriptional regulator n=1 Tax=Puniceicoccus vermicola TaxID=388746 RepID=A0A7X1B2F2_9BACT|nr:LacI family DNA-binding transcriptional regulator [Puniceicoccus vermicola]MBC2604406.1 LacI family DNA-binding transcriptional regulator [Puniceicoccus vermicola]